MPIVKIEDMAGGFMPDPMAQELPLGAASTVTNMRFAGGFAERYRGMANVFGTPGATPYWIAPYASLATRLWVTGCQSKLYAYDGATQFDITPVVPPSGAIDDRYTGGAFNGVLLINNGKDAPWAWGGATNTPAILLPNWDPTHRAGWMRPFGNYIMTGNITKGSTNYPHMVKWSDLAVPGAVPGAWTPAPGNQANERDLAETADIMVDGLAMGEQFIVYKERSKYALRVVGGDYIMDSKRLPGEEGMLARNCVVDTPIGHVVLTAGDVVVHQGGPATSLADGAIRKWIFNNMNSMHAKRSFVVANPQKAEVLVCFPSNDSEVCDLAAVYNWISRKWGVRTLVACHHAATGQINPNTVSLQWETDNDTWDSDATAWNENEYAGNEARVLFARAGAISAFDVGTTDFGNQIASRLERTGMTFGDAFSNKLLRGIYPQIDAPAGTVVRIAAGSAMGASENVTWGPAVDFTVGGSENLACVMVQGRQLAVRIDGTGFQPWRIRSMDLDIQTLGAR